MPLNAFVHFLRLFHLSPQKKSLTFKVDLKKRAVKFLKDASRAQK